jgi:hypothetical protein
MLSANILMLLQADLDTWIKHYNEEMTHSEKYRFGKPARRTFLVLMPLVKEKMLNSTLQTEGVCLSD